LVVRALLEGRPVRETLARDRASAVSRSGSGPLSAASAARRRFGLILAGGVAVAAGVSLAQRSAGEHVLRAVTVPGAALLSPHGLAFAPGRSGSVEPRPAVAAGRRGAAVTPDAAPPPAASRKARLAAARAERAVTIARMTRVLNTFATGLDSATERVLATTIHDESRRWGLDPYLTLAVIETESTYRNEAVSFMGARGLMQIRPFVGEELAARLRLDWDGHATLHDPVVNVTMGVYYLAQLRARFGDLTLALAGYNIGPNAVQGLLDEERQVPTGYVRKVLASYGRLVGRAPGVPPVRGTRVAATATRTTR
jgi:soluble lytic murein transglycosylase-like protein